MATDRAWVTRRSTLWVILPTAFVVVAVVWPLAAVTDRALRPDGNVDVGPLAATLTDPTVMSVLWFSVWQAGLSTALTLAAALPAAWLFARVRFAGRAVLWAALIIPFVLPTVVVATAIGNIAGRGLPAILLAHMFFNYAVVVRVVGSAWAAQGTRLPQAAAVLGAGPVTTFRTVTLPLLAPSILAATSVVYLFTFTSFGVVLLLGGGRLRTVEVEIFQRLRSLDLAAAATLSLVQLVIVGALLVVAARWSQRLSVMSTPTDVTADNATGVLGPTGKPGGRRWAAVGRLAAVGAVGLSMGVLLAWPLVGLVVRSVQTQTGFSLVHWGALAERRGVLTASPLEALWNSVVVASVATAVALVLGVMAVWGLVGYERRQHRQPRKGRVAAFDAVLMLPLGASAVTVGLGLFLALGTGPLDLRSSVLLVPLAQALVALPFVVRIVLPEARSVAAKLRDAATVCGASPKQVLWHVDRPLLARPLSVAGGFAFAVAIGEFGATVVLARPDLPTLPIVLARLLGQPGAANRGQAMAIATVLMLVTAAVVLAADRLRPKRPTNA